MNSSDQNKARDAARNAFSELLPQMIELIVARAQEQNSANEVVNEIWPQLNTESSIKLNNADAQFLHRTKDIPSNIADFAEAIMEAKITNHMASLAETNSYARGASLKKLIESVLAERNNEIVVAAKELLDRENHKAFSSPQRIKQLVLFGLAAKCFAELKQHPQNGDEDQVKRHLKILTLLTTHGSKNDQNELLSKIRDGRTASFPFIVKYLVASKVPTQPWFPTTEKPSLRGFKPELLSWVREAEVLKHVVDRYIQNKGVLGYFLDSTEPISVDNQNRFAGLPETIRLGSETLSKEEHLKRERIKQYKLPNGIVCSIGVSILLESLLRHALFVMSGAVPQNIRGKDLVKRLGKTIILSKDTIAYLDIVFGSEQMALRDAVAHGAFVANNDVNIEQIVGGLTKTLELLICDLISDSNFMAKAAKIAPQPLVGLSSQDEAVFQLQYAGGLNLIQHPSVKEIRKHTFSVLKNLIPDKKLLAWTTFPIWVDLNDLKGTGPRILKDATDSECAQYVALVGSLVVIEEFFRAVQEYHGEPVLHVEKSDPAVIKCELSILDDRQDRLLDPKKLNKLFVDQWPQPAFQAAIKALRSLRDTVLHGGWTSLKHPKVFYLHLVMKMIVTLAYTIPDTDKQTK